MVTQLIFFYSEPSYLKLTSLGQERLRLCEKGRGDENQVGEKDGNHWNLQKEYIISDQISTAEKADVCHSVQSRS